MSRIALLTECTPYNAKRTYRQHLDSIGGNTGNNAYLTALRDLYNAEYVNYGQLETTLEMDLYDTYIVGNLSWITENVALPEFYYSSFSKIKKKGKRFIPISVGTQTADYKSDFTYHPQTISFLQEIADQAIIACRGFYTAELLRKNGIENVEAIGCPSLYHRKDPDFKITKKNKLNGKPIVATGITPWANKNMDKTTILKFFDYALKNNMDFIEQARSNWFQFLFSNKKNNEKEKELERYLALKSKMFFNIDDWRAYVKTIDFSFSGRFHGNVIPLLEGVPALFISIDARTREMCEFFEFPLVEINKMNFTMGINEFYEMTDYSQFNSKYKTLYSRFLDFSNRNGLVIS